MTNFDKLINLMELAPITITEEEANKVIAALRAGQAMRDSFQVDFYASSTAFIDTMDKEKLLEAGQAWDAATKGDDK